MTPSNLPAKKFFLNKKFYVHVKRPCSSPANIDKLIRLFGGQIEQFLDHEVSYVLTDIPKIEWPPTGRDTLLEKARNYNVKLMSLDDLHDWCKKYISTPSSSDEDDETANIKELQQPFIKFEDQNCHFAPSIKEFINWPTLNITGSLPVGKSFFSDSSLLSTPSQSMNNNHHPNNSAQLTQQAASLKTTTQNIHTSASTANQQLIPIVQRGVKRRHSVYCEICNQKLTDRIEDHIQTQTHKMNTEKLNWSEVRSVIDSLPSLRTLNMHRLTNLTPPNGVEHQEFLCLHKVDTVTQLFSVK